MTKEKNVSYILRVEIQIVFLLIHEVEQII